MRIYLLLVVLLCALGVAGLTAPASPAAAAEGDLFPPGTAYHATTYSGHANYHLWPDTGKENIVDLTGWQSPAGETLDNGANFRMPVHAPGDGTVEQVSEGYGGGWGNSLIWTSADGREQIHVAHLEEVARTGSVILGEVIAYEGSTGYSVPSDFNHLHVSRMLDGAVAPVVLSGVTLKPDSHRQSRGAQREYMAVAVKRTRAVLELEARVGADPGTGAQLREFGVPLSDVLPKAFPLLDANGGLLAG